MIVIQKKGESSLTACALSLSLSWLSPGSLRPTPRKKKKKKRSQEEAASEKKERKREREKESVD